jgi:twitching motility protein PilT
MMTAEELIRQARESGASDIHLIYGLPPMYRLAGQLMPMRQEKMTDEDCDGWRAVWRATVIPSF